MPAARVKGDSVFCRTPKCDVGGVSSNVLERNCALPQAVGTEGPIYTPKMDVQDIFRSIDIEWDKSPVFANIGGFRCN